MKNKSKYTNHKLYQFDFRFLSLRFECYLVFGYWILEIIK